MYNIIGADQQEYGPVSTDQMRQWIKEGRVNAQTQVQPEGATDWQPLSSIPEFAADFPSGPALAPGSFSPAYDGGNALQLVQGPAIALMVVAIICFLAAGASLLMNVLGTSMSTFGGNNSDEMERIIQMTSGSVGIVFNIIGLGISAFVLVGALKLKKLESYGLVMAATICSMLPCISPCCCVGLPVGIWVLIVLAKPEVKGAFH